MQLTTKLIAVIVSVLVFISFAITPAYAAEAIIEHNETEPFAFVEKIERRLVEKFGTEQENINEDIDEEVEDEIKARTAEESPAKIYRMSDIMTGKVCASELQDIYDYYMYMTGQDTVPLLYQTDYPDIPFSHGTVYTSGCGVSCVAMVGSYFHEEEITPGMLGEMFNTPGCSNSDRMEQASEYLELPLQEVTWLWSKAYKALQNGQVVISLQLPGLFTTEGHFIVLTGINEDGLITVNDPYEPHYWTNQERINGFETGFTPEQILGDGSCFWIYEKKEVPNIEIVGDLEILGLLFDNGLSYSLAVE